MAHCKAVLLMLLFAVSGCTTADLPPPEGSAAASLIEQLDFSRAKLIDRALPKPTDEDAFLLPIGPTVVIEPGTKGTIALQVDDPKDREVDATLMQFGDVEKYLRVPALQTDDNEILENGFNVAKSLCAGLCDAVFTIVVTEEVVFADGTISRPSTRQIVLDCRSDGDPDLCSDQMKSRAVDCSKAGNPDVCAAMNKNNADGKALLCGNVAKGELLLTGDVLLDTHFDAVRELGVALDSVDTIVGEQISSMAMALDLSPESDAGEVARKFGERRDAATAGLVVLLGDPGCALRLGRVAHVLAACDPQDAISLPSMQCKGVCEPKPDAGVCADAPSLGCRGAVDGEPCAGNCVGACERTLDVADACDGTCTGTCDGECPDDGSGGCAGPCLGLCTGTCSATSSDQCNGSCSGMCTDASGVLADCAQPLVGYCDSEKGAAIECIGDCFGVATLAVGSSICQISALSLGRIFPRCEAPIVQIRFAYKDGLSANERDEFAALVADLNPAFGTLYGMLARINMLVAANADLATAAMGTMSSRLNKLLALTPSDSGLSCGRKALPIAQQLSPQSAALTVLRSDVTTVIATIMPTILPTRASGLPQSMTPPPVPMP